jgi:energy-coupling factor transporter ATP-binding protein EcfA2
MDTLSKKPNVDAGLKNPFPGLRPFHPDEAHLFFGRDGQSEEILKNLSVNKFVAVLGASGSGKSSLIYCGLLPALYGGFLHNGRSKWRIAISRPGSNPLANLAASLATAFCDGSGTENIEIDSLINQTVLKRSEEGLTNVIRQYGLASNENVLILVDQFEELFRYQYSGEDADAADITDHFVNLLVNIVKQEELPVYLVTTMRSDFIGDCSPFQEFTRLINDSNYLIPRMTRDDFRKAIVGPVAVAGGMISDQLVQLLLNEMGNNPDHLPVLQHALMRTWDYWINYADTNIPVGIVEYEAIGRLDQALSNHANEAFNELSVDERRTCEIIFKSLTEKGADNRGIRRPTSISDLAEIAETTIEEVKRVVEVFREKGRTFLTPSPDIELDDHSMVDISHESLMRVWDKLRIWVDEESNAVKMYIRLAESADLYSQGKANLWGPPDLQLALNWRDKQKPCLAWAIRHHPAFERTMVYLRTSEEEYIAEEENKIRLHKRALRRSRIVALILGTAGMVAIGLGILALMQRQDAIKAGNEAMEQRSFAQEQEKLALLQAEEAEKQRALALVQMNLAEENRKAAEEQRLMALQNLNEADRQRIIATRNEEEALEQRRLAEENETRALDQQRLAEQASLEAERRRMLSIAQSMAVKSEQMRTDSLLKGMLAFQAYHFNNDYQGADHNPDVFKALYSGLRFFKGTDYNVFGQHNSIVRTTAQLNDIIYSAGSDGRVSSLDNRWNNSKAVIGNLPIVKKLIPSGIHLYGVTSTGLFRYNTATENSDFFHHSNPEIRDLFITESESFIMVFEQGFSVSDGFGKPATFAWSTKDRINAAKYIPGRDQLFLAFADGRINAVNMAAKSDPVNQATFVNIPESNWGEIGYNPIKNIVAGGFGNNLGTVYIWNAGTGNQIAVLRGHTAKITGIDFSSDGSLMATASYDGTVRLWHLDDLNTLPVVFDDHSSWATTVMFTRDGKYIVSGGRNGNIRVYPVEIRSMVDEYCIFLSRGLNQEEWHNYVGADILFNPIKCNTSE